MTRTEFVIELKQQLAQQQETIKQLEGGMMHDHLTAQAQLIEKQQETIARLEAELAAYRQGGLTEEILRRQDGFLKLGKGLCVVSEAEWDAQDETIRVLREALEEIAEMNHDNLKSSIKTSAGDSLKMLAALYRLFNDCRVKAQHALGEG